MSSEIREVDVATAKSRIERGEAILIDVREANEHALESIAGATLIPLSSFDPARVAAGITKPVIVHCAAGARSARAVAMLREAGLKDVSNLQGGINAWKAAGLPLAPSR
jgi:rhodanese-related sulfurtransferase